MKILYHFLHGPIPWAMILIVLGFFVAKLASESLNKVFKKRLTPQQSMLLRRVTFYFILLLFIASSIQQLGFHIGALLGATGILTVAIGIASQTSMSNIISGIFIIGEKPFEIGDTIQVNEVLGEVISIDFLSAKIRTNENTMVRIPNEVLIKSMITNISYFPTRRADVIFVIAYKADLDYVKKILLEKAEKNEFCLKDPKPNVIVVAFEDSGVKIQFSVWARKEHYNELKTTIQQEIKIAFEKNAIEFATQSRLFYAGNESITLPIKIIANEGMHSNDG